MNLAVDIGNSSAKFAVFDGNEKITVFRTLTLPYKKLKKKFSSYKIERVIISSVKKIPADLMDGFTADVQSVHLLSHKSRLPFQNLYQTPESLGTDRIAAVAGAFNIFPGSEVLVIDAGTAITYDFLSGEVYKGGNISPGLEMRFKALNSFTGKLPLVTPKAGYSFPGRTTAEAISAGVITGLIYEINEYIRTFEKDHAVAKILLTGGNGEFLKDKLQKQHLYLPDLVMEGLNFILDYNAK